jgi:hypothetical protein
MNFRQSLLSIASLKNSNSQSESENSRDPTPRMGKHESQNTISDPDIVGDLIQLQRLFETGDYLRKTKCIDLRLTTEIDEKRLSRNVKFPEIGN